MGTGKEGY